MAAGVVTMPVAFSDVEALAANAPAAEHRYGDAPNQFARLWLPDSRVQSEKVLPIVLLFHGGCWLKSYDLAHLSPMATALASRGFAVSLPEYRRVGEDSGGWPGTANDVYAIIMALHTVPALDTQRVLFAGHSAGGHLALWAASLVRAFADNGIVVKGVVGLAVITDLDAYRRGGNNCQAVTPKFLGETPEEVPEYYASASPAELGLQLPIVLLHGNAAPLLPPPLAHAIAGAEANNIADAGHFDLIHPGTPAFEPVVAALTRLLEAAP